jgi:hypothetical protein
MYLSQTDLLEMDHDQLVGKILMRMTPWQLGMIALQWFMDHHTDFNPTLKDLCLKLAHFVLTNNYVECKELNGTMYQQVVGTAMGTSFSVVYAIIFMIYGWRPP